MTFTGFPSKKMHLTPIPGPFFSELLPQIDHLGELKLTLYVFWRLDQLTGNFRWLQRSDFLEDTLFIQGLASNPEQVMAALDEALTRAVKRGVLLQAEITVGEQVEIYYFLNSAKGRAAVQGIQSGQWLPDTTTDSESSEPEPISLRLEPPNIFRLYEQHIGPLTPLIAEALGEAEDTYPASWIEEAFRIAVERNARNWRYIEAVLKRWQEEGRDAQEDRRDSQKTGRKYIEGDLSDYIKH